MEHFSKIDTTIRYNWGNGQYGLAAFGKTLSTKQLNRYRGNSKDPALKHCTGGGSNIHAPGSKLWK